MKKNLFSLGLIPFFVFPIIITSSCSNTTKEVGLESQYDLFTNDLVIQQNVEKNLALSIDNNLIGNIYSIPTNLQPGINYSFGFKVDKNELELSVKLYSNDGTIILHNDQKNGKIIGIITGFHDISPDQQSIIDSKFKEFQDLLLPVTKKMLPSSIDLEYLGLEKFPAITNTTNSFSLIADDDKGNLSVSLSIFSKTGYPLKPVSGLHVTKVVKWMTLLELNSHIDSLYIGLSIKPIFPLISAPIFASSVINETKLQKVFLENGVPYPEAPALYTLTPVIESNDSRAEVNITFNLTNKQGILMVPSETSNKCRITNFKSSPDGLLKATNEAYNHFRNSIPADPIGDIYPPTGVLPSIEFGVFTSSNYTFQCVLSPPTELKIYTNGYVKYGMTLKVSIGGELFDINPSISTSINPDSPSYSTTIEDLSFYWTGFLTEYQDNANDKYQELNDLPKHELTYEPEVDISDDINFEELWLSLFERPKEEIIDPFGIRWNNGLKTNYVFSKSDGTNYDVHSSIEGLYIYKTVKMKVSIHSLFTNYEYPSKENLNLEFKFSVKGKIK